MSILPSLLLALAPQCAEPAPSTIQRVAAISGDWLVTGKESADAAAVHPRQGSSYGPGVPLVPASPGGGTMYGYSVAIDGSTAVVGRPLFGSSAGTAHVFELVGGTWIETAELHASDEAALRHFGWSVDVEGDRIVVGAPRGDAGRAYVYERVGGAWVEAAKLAPACCAGDQFGWSVAVSGDAVAIGAPTDDTSWSDTGGVTIYRRTGAGWSFEQALGAPFSGPEQEFGTDVALAGNLALVGAPGGVLGPFAGNQGGAAYLYERGPAGWVKLQTLVGSATANPGDFGAAVALAADVIVVGDPQHAVGGTSYTGEAYVFAPATAGSWLEVARITKPPGFLVHGFDVGTDGERACVSSLFDEVDVHSLAPADSLAAAPASVSLSVGGAHAFSLGAGLLHAGLVHLVVGSASGASPGFPVDGVPVPLVLDAYTIACLQLAGSPLLPGTLGVLDACGKSSAALVVPPGTAPALAGLTLHHAFVAFAPGGAVVLASDAESVALAP